jgi:hypothetical protein
MPHKWVCEALLIFFRKNFLLYNEEDIEGTANENSIEIL